MSFVINLFIPDLALHDAVVEALTTTALPWRDIDKNLGLDDGALVVVDQAAWRPDLIARLGALPEKPIILMLGDSADDNAGDAKGDDLVAESFAKPFRLGHLLGRIGYYRDTAPLLRDRAVVFGDFRLEPRPRQLAHPALAEPMRLTEKETALLMFLATSDQPVTRRDILAAVWGYDERIDTHTLETHLYQLRRKLDETKAEWLISANGAYALNRGAG